MTSERNPAHQLASLVWAAIHSPESADANALLVSAEHCPLKTKSEGTDRLTNPRRRPGRQTAVCPGNAGRFRADDDPWPIRVWNAPC